MTAMVTQRSGRGGLEGFRKSWLCGDCGASNVVACRECEDCGQVRGSSAPRTSQSFALNNQGNGSVVNNVMVVGGNVDNGEEHYHIPQQTVQAEPEYEYRMLPQKAIDCHCPDERPMSNAEKALVLGTNVAVWSSVFVLVPAALFFIFLIGAGIAQILRVVP